MNKMKQMGKSKGSFAWSCKSGRGEEGEEIKLLHRLFIAKRSPSRLPQMPSRNTRMTKQVNSIMLPSA